MKRKLKTISFKSLAIVLSILTALLSLPLTAFAFSDESIKETVGGTPMDEVIEVVERRDETTKHFRLEDGTYTAARYDVPVHYLDENGSWQDIDNTLSSSGRAYSTENARIKFAKKVTGNMSLFTLHDGNRKITMSLDGAKKKTPGAVTNLSPQIDESATQLQKMMTLNKLSSKILYADILDGVDLEYVVISNDIKENIIVKEKKDSYTYTFTIKLNNLSAKLTDDGNVLLFDPSSQETVYLIPAPIVYDTNHNYAESNDAYFTLSESGKNTYSLTVTADSAWMNSDERVFPITIDPTVSYGSSGRGIISESVSSGSPNLCTVNQTSSIGYSTTASVGYQRMYLKAPSLPTIPADAVLSSAILTLYQSSYSGIASGIEVAAYPVTGTWYGSYYSSGSINFSEINWNSQPTFSDNIIELKKLSSSTSYKTVTWDITRVAKQWLSAESPLANNGIVLKLKDETTTTWGVVSFYNDYPYSASLSYRNPVLTLSYAQVQGLEPYYSYYETSAGTAGTGYINSFNGNLTFTHDFAATTDSLMPYTFGLAYNGYMAGKYYTSDYANVPMTIPSAGKGFKLYSDETIVSQTIGDATYYIWNDADGTDHYFSYIDAFSAYCDNEGLQLELTVDSNGYTIKDDSGNIKHFDSSGYKDYTRDVNSNRRNFERNTKHQLTHVYLQPYAYDSIEQLSFTYNNTGLIRSVQNVQTGLQAQFYYSDTTNGTAVSQTSGGYLRKIVYVYSSTDTTVFTVLFDYDSNGRITLVKELYGKTACQFEYNANGKIEKVKKYIGATETNTVADMLYDAEGNEIAYKTTGITYQHMQTTMRVAGTDDTYGNEDDVYAVNTFDRAGRVISSYLLQNNIIYNSQSYTYEDTSVKTKNKVSSSASMAGVSGNHIQNPGFDPQNDGTLPNWTLYGSGYTSNSSYDRIDGNFYNLSINKDTGSSASSLYNYFNLKAGTYTFSVLMNQYSVKDDAEVELCVVNANTGVEFAVKKIEPSKAMSNSWERKNITFTVGYDAFCCVYIQLSYKSSRVNYSSLKIDSAMLESGNGSTVYNILGGSDFEDNIEYWTNYNASESTNAFRGGGSAYFPGLKADERITQSYDLHNSDIMEGYLYGYESEPEMDQKTYVISAWGKCDSVATNDYSNFMLKVILHYHNTSFVSTYCFPFNDGVAEWQYLAGAVSTEPDSNGFRHYLKKIEVQIVHQNNPSPAYVDEIALYEDCGGITYYEYNTKGYCTKERNSKGTEVNYTYGSNGVDVTNETSATSNYSYSYSNHVVTSVSNIKTVNGEDKGSYIEYTYDNYGNILQTDTYGSDMETLFTSESASYSKNAHTFAAVTQKVDISGATTYYYYTSRAHLAGVTNGSNDGISYEYNIYGQLIGAVPAHRNSDGTWTSYDAMKLTYSHDDNHQLKSVYTNINSFGFAYNEYGNLTTERVNGSWVKQYSYQNGYGKLQQEIFANDYYVYYQYDGLDNISGICYNGTQTAAFNFQYDNAGRIVQKTDHTHNAKYYYSYNADGQVSQEQMLSNGVTVYTWDIGYDELGRIKSSYRYYQNAKTAPLVYTEYEYDELGNISKVVCGGVGLDVVYEYDDFGRVISKKRKKTYGSKIPYEQTYHYKDVKGHEYTLLQGENHIFNNSSAVINYEYDSNQKLKTIRRDFTKNLYRYDASDRLEMEAISTSDLQIKLYHYLYDSIGNRISKREYIFPERNFNFDNFKIYNDKLYLRDDSYEWIEGFNDGVPILYENRLYWNYVVYVPQTIVGETKYQYDKDKLIKVNGSDLTYDEIGNLISYNYDFNTCEWNGRLLTQVYIGASPYRYEYNENGIRTAKISNVGCTRDDYVLEGNKVARIFRTTNGVMDADVRFYFDAEGKPAAMRVFDKYGKDYTIYFVTDALGNVNALLDSDGNLLVTYEYDAFGKVTITDVAKNGPSSYAKMYNPYMYRGYFYDTETGFYYLQSRYYNPEWGRFISADDVAYLFEDGKMTNANLYVYCNNNPIMYTDPDGHLAFFVITMLIGAVIGAAAGVGIGYLAGYEGKDLIAWGIGGAVIGGIIGAATGMAISYSATGSVTASYSQIKAGFAAKHAMGLTTNKPDLIDCFVAGTLILTESGLIPIEEIEPGMLVWATDPETRETALKPVVQLFHNEKTELVHVTVNGEEIICTTEHPFYSPIKGWTSACQLRAGDILVLVNGEYAIVEQVQHEILETPVVTYNFEVADFHTYYVGDLSVLVHNKCKEQLFKDFENHAFSKQHVKSGIENLGSSHRDIFDNIYNQVMSKLPQAVERSNQFYTNINNFDVTVRFYIQNGEIMRINAMMGKARVLGVLLT